MSHLRRNELSELSVAVTSCTTLGGLLFWQLHVVTLQMITFLELKCINHTLSTNLFINSDCWYYVSCLYLIIILLLTRIFYISGCHVEIIHVLVYIAVDTEYKLSLLMSLSAASTEIASRLHKYRFHTPVC